MHPPPHGFHKAPFEPSADPALIFHHSSLEKTRAEFMLSQISDRRGLFLVVGEPGTGKTTLLLSLRLQGGDEKPYAYLVCSEEESYAALALSCCKALGLTVEAEDAESLMQDLTAHLTGRSEAGVATTLLIDAAENLTDEALNGLVEIAGADMGKRRLLHIVVVARPEIEAALERTGLDLADAAIAFRCRLEALGQEEIEAYIEHRLKAAGYEGPALFSGDALQRIGAASKGLPGQVSQICRVALEAMQEYGRETIGDDLATYAIERCGMTDEHPVSPGAAVSSDPTIQELWKLARGGAEDGSQSTLAEPDDAHEYVDLAHYLKARPESAPDTTPEEVATKPALVATAPEEAATAPEEITTTPEEAATTPEEGATTPAEVAPAQRRPWLVPFDWEVEKEASEAELSEVLTAWKESAAEESAMTSQRPGSAYWPAVAMIAVGLFMGSAFAIYQAPDELLAWLGVGTPDEIEVAETQTAESVQDPLVQAEPIEQDSAPPQEETVQAEPEATSVIAQAVGQTNEPAAEPPPAPATELAALPAEAPRLTVAPASGREDQGIPIELQVAAGSGNAEVDLSLALAGLPEGTVLSAGRKQSNGTWTLDPDELSGLTLLPPEHYSGKFMVEVTAAAMGSAGDSAATIDVLPVDVAGVADPPKLNVADAAGREDEAVPLEIQAEQTDRDGSERLVIFVADLPEGASLSAGEHQDHGNWILTAEQLTGLELLPPKDFSGRLEINAGAMSQEIDNEDRKFTTRTLNVTIAGVADVPQLTSSDASGREDQAIPLDIQAATADGDGSEQLEIFVAGLPEGARLSAGNSQSDGKWTLTRDQLTDLALRPPEDFNGSLELTVGVISREPDSDDVAITSNPLAVTVAAVTDAPHLTVSDSSGSEDHPIALDIRASLKEGIGSAGLSILLSDLPEGARLSAGSDEGDGRWALEPDQLAGLNLTPPPSFSGAFEITAEAIAKEAGEGVAAATKEALKIIVAGIADKPNLAVKQANGQADRPIPLDITASLGDSDGSEKLSIILSGLPEGARLSAGEADANGVWRLTEKQLADLKLVPPPQFSGEFEITAGAISLEEGGNTAKTSQPLKVTVAAAELTVVQPTVAEPTAAEPKDPDIPAASEPEATQQAALTPNDPKAEAYMGRGDKLLALGDVAAARLFYELALDYGHAGAATAIGKTYDPAHLRLIGVHGAANKAKAIEWYKRAIRAGDKSATIHLKTLSHN